MPSGSSGVPADQDAREFVIVLREGKSPTTEWPHERGSAMHLEGSTDMPRIELVSVDTASAWPIDDFRSDSRLGLSDWS